MLVHPTYMSLTLCTPPGKLYDTYSAQALKHNQSITCNPTCDAGFDIFLPEDTVLTDSGVNAINFQIQCSAVLINTTTGTKHPTGFYTYARSSLAKTPLRVANNQGIIDAGYRGHIIGMFDCKLQTYTALAHTRLIQICAPSLVPIIVTVVPYMEQLGEVTARGENGIGSTGV